MVSQLLEMMLRPFRAFDAEEVRVCLDANGGVDKLRLTFFKEGDIGNDGVWDIWKLEGPGVLVVLPRLTPRPHLAQRRTQGLIAGTRSLVREHANFARCSRDRSMRPMSHGIRPYAERATDLPRLGPSFAHERYRAGVQPSAIDAGSCHLRVSLSVTSIPCCCRS